MLYYFENNLILGEALKLLHAILLHVQTDSHQSILFFFFQEGFYCHHAESRYLMLVHWLPSTPNTLPANASHRVGVSAFVMNEKNEVSPHGRPVFS